MRRQPRAGWLLTGLVCLIGVFMVARVAAATANLSHAYHASTDLRKGALVSLDPSRANTVQLANTNNAARLLGVAVSTNDSLLAVETSNGLAQIATSGTANALVSTLNGEIAVGDQIAVSPFDGIGMKAAPGSRVIGLAQIAFKMGTPGAGRQSVTDRSGHKYQIAIGYVPVEIAIATDSPGNSAGAQLNSLQKVAASLTGRTIPTVRLLISLAVAIVALATLLMLVYAAIYGSIISVGRNPLAKHAIFRSLRGVISMILLIGVVASSTIYFLLK